MKEHYKGWAISARMPCYNGNGCPFWVSDVMTLDDLRGRCICETQSRHCPHGREGIEGTLLIGDEVGL